MKIEDMKNLYDKTTIGDWFNTHVCEGEDIVTSTIESDDDFIHVGAFSNPNNAEFLVHAHNKWLKLLEVAGWAEIFLEMYGHDSNVQDPTHQLACALRDLQDDSV